MIFAFVRRALVWPAAGLLLACAVAACNGTGENGASPLYPYGSAYAGASSHGLAPAPAPSATEFITGIDIAAHPHGITRSLFNMWFAESGVNKIGRISPKGVVTEFSGPSSGPNNIVQGPDGNFWFTEGLSLIGRMTPAGKVKEFPVGNEAYGPFDITSGKDGNLWFTYRTPSTMNAIGRISTSGAVTLFTAGLSTGDVAVHDLTAGPDGNVWFTEEFGNRIGRITPSGTITEFSNGISLNAGLVDITTGPDGNLWFTENNLNQVGRITPSGVVTEFSAGITPNSSVGSITSADGYVWFTELATAHIGRISMTGHVVEYSVPAAVPADIAVGAPNGALWITDVNGNGIVRFEL